MPLLSLILLAVLADMEPPPTPEGPLPAAGPETPQPPPPPVAPTQALHDGFHFRGAVGGGYLSNTETPPGDRLYGGSPVIEAYFGGAVTPHTILGGFITVAPVTSPKFDYAGTTTATGGNVDMTLVLLGGFVDYYLSATGGFHVLGSLALSTLTVSDNSISDSARGFSVGAGAGYDWWLGNAWSLGVLGRFNYARGTLDSSTESTILPSLAVTIAYH